MACRDWAAKVGGGVLGRVWALVAALALLLGLAATAPAPAQAASFRDVPSGQWYTSWVDKASDQGLMSGFTDPATGRPTGCFGPDEPLTRAQVATVLWRMAGGPSSGHASFPDVERGSWYDAPVAWCVGAGVVTGYTSGPDRGHFRPDRPVTRRELATMVYRYAKYAGMDVADPDPAAFRSTTDWRTVDSWASEALTWTAAVGVLSGVDNHDGTYSVVPFGTATRAMAAKVFVVLSGSPSAAKATYTVTFDPNGGSAVKAQTVSSGTRASKPADPAKSGYAFKGWYSDKSLTKAYDFNSTVRSNLTLYAKWEAKFQAYAILYKDGLLSLQAGPDTDPSHGKVLGKWEWNGSSCPWYDKRARVRSVVARDRVVVSDGYGMFRDLANCRSMDLSKLDISHASDFCSMFYGCSSLTSLDLSGWDTSGASNLSSMFWGCSSLQALDVSSWDVSNASNLSFMFCNCSSLRSLDLSGWDTSGASDLSSMFSGCSSLANLGVSGWDVSNVASFSSLGWGGMFSGCSSLASLDLSGWDTSPASSLYSMFLGCSSLQALDASGWDVSNASDLSGMFYDCSSLSSLDLSGWDVSNVSDLSQMFYGCSSLQALDLSGWDVSKTSSLYSMFSGCSSLQSLDLSGWDVSNVACFSSFAWGGMFSGCSALASLDVSGWDVSNASDLSQMFSDCSSLQALDLSGWDVSSATDLHSMFSGCSSLRSLDVSGWDVSNASDLSRMFSDCLSLATLDLSGWDVSNASDLSQMFSGCSSLANLGVSGWDVSSAKDLFFMFYGCSSLDTVTLGVGCGLLVGELPSGPWYDAEGKEYDRPPAGVAGTFTKTKTAALAVAADAVADSDASLSAQIVEGEQDGLRFAVVPEGASFGYGLEYPELAGRYVGPGVYLTGYVGESDSLVVPLEVAGVPVVSANLSRDDSDRAGMTSLAALSFERVEGKVSSLAQLDVSGNVLSSLNIEGLDALVRLNCEGNPIADLAALQAWAAQDGHEAKLPQVQDVTPVEPDNAQVPSDPQEPASPDVPTKPAEPANSETSSAEPEEPSDPAVPSEPEQPGSSDVSGEPDQPGDDSVGSDMGESDEQEEPADTAGLGEVGQDGDASATEEPAIAAELAGPGEEPLALAA